MRFTQVELTFGGTTEVWWLPLPSNKITIGETIKRIDKNFKEEFQEWKVTQICITLDEEQVPHDARMGWHFMRESQTESFLTT